MALRGHKKVYCDALGYVEGETIPSEISGAPAVDIHHIDARGMGGTSNPYKNSIFNLMAVTRAEHEKYGDKKQYKKWLKHKHLLFLMKQGVMNMGVFQEVNFKESSIEFLVNE